MAFAWRHDSLLMRLLLMQGLLALALVALFTAFFYAERAATVSRLLADRWAPSLHEALGHGSPSSPPARLAIERRAEAPALAIPWPTGVGLRVTTMRDALSARGLTVEAIAVEYGDPDTTLWLRMAGGGDAPWFGFPGHDAAPILSVQVVSAFMVGFVIVVGASMGFTRWLTRPLRQIEAAMRGSSPDAKHADERRPGVAAGAPPELRAIDAAWCDLLDRYRVHESERAILLAGVSHDLRSPLARIRMAADMLPEAAAQRRDSIVRNVQVADRLIESFLDLVRAAELPMDERVDLAELVRRVAARCERSAQELVVLAPAECWCRDLNSLLLERLIANLLDNAFRHGAAPVQLVLRMDGGAPQIEVSDAGAGIPVEQWTRATQAFARGDASRGTPGSGLGLAIVARIARRLAGTVSFARHEGRFTVRVLLGPRSMA